MTILPKSRQLKKNLSLFNVYTIATGATIASGFFLLPGIAFARAGSAVVLSYFIAALPLIPAVCSMAELSTAMPRSGGIYYFLDRSMGPFWGTISGLGTWFALSLKAAFALIGIGVYINIFLPDFPFIPISVGFAILFGLINLMGAKKTGSLQALLVVGLLMMLFWFAGAGLGKIEFGHFSDFFDRDLSAIFSTAGLVFISYIGLTKIASISEEVKKPEKNIPLGMFLSFGTALFFYILGTFIMVGVLTPEKLANNLTPVAATAAEAVGSWGVIVVSIAAIFAFFSVANAGILSASRYPLGMSRDNLIPPFFRKLTPNKIPRNAIVTTVFLIIVTLILFDPVKIAKVASAFQLLLFVLSNIAVIIMRESRIHSYDPGFHSPLYPWMQIFGILATIWIIIVMGWISIAFSLGMICVGAAWYFYYVRQRVTRVGAIYHLFAHLGQRRFEGLDRELRGIMREKGLREHDPYEIVVATAHVIDLDVKTSFKEVVHLAASSLSQRLDVETDVLEQGFMQGTRIGMTPVSHGVALPHLRLHDIEFPELAMIRSHQGLVIDMETEVSEGYVPGAPVHAFFFLISPDDAPSQHLRILAYIAEQVDDQDFLSQWLSAKGEKQLKELLLRLDRIVSLELHADSETSELIGQNISELELPRGCIPVLIHRMGLDLFPESQMELKEGDQLVVIGPPDRIRQLIKKYIKPISDGRV